MLPVPSLTLWVSSFNDSFIHLTNDPLVAKDLLSKTRRSILDPNLFPYGTLRGRVTTSKRVLLNGDLLNPFTLHEVSLFLFFSWNYHKVFRCRVIDRSEIEKEEDHVPRKLLCPLLITIIIIRFYLQWKNSTLSLKSHHQFWNSKLQGNDIIYKKLYTLLYFKYLLYCIKFLL